MNKQIFNSIELLHLIADDQEIKQIQSLQPEEFGYILNKGRLASSDSKEIVNQNELKARIAAISSTFELLLKKIDKQFLPVIQKKIKNLRIIEFSNNIISALSSSTLIALILLNNDRLTNIILASLGLAGSLLAVYLKKHLGEGSFNNRNIQNDFDKIIDLKISAETLYEKINLAQSWSIEHNDKKYLDLFEKAEELAKQIKMILYKYQPWKSKF